MTDNLNAFYVQAREGKAARTDELIDGMVFVDYDADGRVLGVEILPPSPQAMTHRHVADLHYLGGPLRPVYEHADGRQYVVGDDGVKVYGVWYIPREAGADLAAGAYEDGCD